MTEPATPEDAVYIATFRGQEGPYPAAQVRNLWTRGLLPESALYWRRGMAEWRPVREFAEAPAAPPPVPPTTPSEPISAAPPPTAGAGVAEAFSPAAPTEGSEQAAPPAQPAAHGGLTAETTLPLPSAALGPSAPPPASPPVAADPPVVRVATRTGEYGPYTRAQMLAMWSRGQLPRDAYAWAPGMPGWQPVTDYFRGAAQATAEQPAAPGQAASAGVSSVQRLTRLLSGLAIAGAVFAGLRAVSEVGRILDLRVFGADREMEYLFRTGVLATFQVILGGSALAAFCLWLHQAALNVRRAGARGLRFTPEWVVGWLFVPFANLLKPYEAVTELARASARPQGWEEEPAPPAVTRWWALWVLHIIGYMAGSLIARPTDAPPDEWTRYRLPLSSFAISLLGIATWTAWRRVVLHIGDLQARLRPSPGAEAAPTEAPIAGTAAPGQAGPAAAHEPAAGESAGPAVVQASTGAAGGDAPAEEAAPGISGAPPETAGAQTAMLDAPGPLAPPEPVLREPMDTGMPPADLATTDGQDDAGAEHATTPKDEAAP